MHKHCFTDEKPRITKLTARIQRHVWLSSDLESPLSFSLAERYSWLFSAKGWLATTTRWSALSSAEKSAFFLHRHLYDQTCPTVHLFRDLYSKTCQSSAAQLRDPLPVSSNLQQQICFKFEWGDTLCFSWWTNLALPGCTFLCFKRTR